MGVYLSLVHPEGRATTFSAVLGIGRQELPYQHAHRIVRPDGTTVWMRVTVTGGQGAADARDWAGTLQETAGPQIPKTSTVSV